MFSCKGGGGREHSRNVFQENLAIQSFSFVFTSDGYNFLWTVFFTLDAIK